MYSCSSIELGRGSKGPQRGVEGLFEGSDGPKRGVESPQRGVEGLFEGDRGPQRGVETPQRVGRGPLKGDRGPLLRRAPSAPKGGSSAFTRGPSAPKGGSRAPKEGRGPPKWGRRPFRGSEGPQRGVETPKGGQGSLQKGVDGLYDGSECPQRGVGGPPKGGREPQRGSRTPKGGSRAFLSDPRVRGSSVENLQRGVARAFWGGPRGGLRVLCVGPNAPEGGRWPFGGSEGPQRAFSCVYTGFFSSYLYFIVLSVLLNPVCNNEISLPPYSKISASSSKNHGTGSNCLPDDGYIFTNKAWCAKDNNSKSLC